MRSPDRARDVLAGIDGVEIEQWDLMDPASIDAFADRFLATGRPLHILVNSAGIQNVPLTRDARGYEAQFATNHLGHFQLTARLWQALRRAGGARVVTVSAWAHNLSPVIFDDPNFEQRQHRSTSPARSDHGQVGDQGGQLPGSPRPRSKAGRWRAGFGSAPRCSRPVSVSP